MWSSLSSYLYNEDAKDVAAPSPPAAAAAPRPPTKNNTPVSLRTPSPRSSPLTIALSGGSNKGSAGKLNRASFDKSDNVSILRGVIVGTKGTGKTSLIRRLRGEDPFQKQSKSGQQRSSVEKRKLMALVPWNVPTDTDKINNLTIKQEERVQLYVSESVGFLQSQEEQSFRKEWSTALQSQRGKEWNFAVWMIDPGMKDMMQYLQSGLDILFPTHAAGSDKAMKQPLIQHLCILLNFRDMQQDGKSSTLSQSRRMIETVRKNIEEGDGNTAGESTKLPIIVVCESSMRDCYGLQQLHSFITLPYLAQKEDQLLRRAKLAQKQQIKLTKTLMESEVVDYNDFVATDNHVVIEEKPDTPKQKTPKEIIERRKLEEEKERLKKQLKQQQQELDSRMHRRKSPVILGNQIISNEPPKESHTEVVQGSAGHNRKLFQTPSKPVAAKAVVPKKEVGETSLESFFSEDESEDEVEAPRRVDKRSKSIVTRLKASSSRVQVLDSDDSSNDSDDSDDDFYIDNFGTRSSSDFPKKSFPKIEPTVSVDSSEGSKSNIEDKGGDANAESVSNENNENDVGVSKIDSDEKDEEVNAMEEGPVNSEIDIEHEGGNSNAEDNNVEEASSKSNEEDESEKAITSTETMNFDAGPVDDHSVAEEEDEVDASNAEDKEEEDTGETSNTGDDEIKASGEDLGDVTEAPAKETNVEDDAATDKVDETAEANNNVEIDSCDTDSPVMKNDDATEEDKTAATPREQQIEDGEDEPEEDDTVSAPTTQQILDDDDASEEENTAAVTTPQDDGDGDGDDEPEEENRDSTCPEQQTLNEDEEAKEDSTASAPSKRQTLDEEKVSVDENIATSTASTKRQTLNDDNGGDESEDEFIVPASEEQQVYDSDYESSKVSGDAGDAMREANMVKNKNVQQDTTVPTQRDADVAETKTNGDNNTTTVSSAALAAIEQARLEAEQMMAQSQPQPTKPKKEKKKKKEKAKAKVRGSSSKLSMAKKEKKKKAKKEDSSSNSF